MSNRLMFSLDSIGSRRIMKLIPKVFCKVRYGNELRYVLVVKDSN